jgi:hypothetical protein
MTCSSCVHWLRRDGDENGKCRRYPPRFVFTDSQSEFPVTCSTDLCGEHRKLPVFIGKGYCGRLFSEQRMSTLVFCELEQRHLGPCAVSDKTYELWRSMNP